MTRALVPSTTSRHCATIVAIVTRNGHAAAVLNSSGDLASLEETIDVLSDPAALADIREADVAYLHEVEVLRIEFRPDAYRPLSPS